MKTKLIGILVGLLGILSIATYWPYLAQANPLGFLIQNQGTYTITATTSVSYMTPGTATTTYTYDTYTNGQGSVYSTDSLALALQFIGSTTPNNSVVATTTYNVALEYSQDNIDWYTNEYTTFGTTTTPINITAPISSNFTLGTTTLGGIQSASTTPQKRLINVPAPTRYIRAIVTIPILSAPANTNGAVWGEFIGQKQQR